MKKQYQKPLLQLYQMSAAPALLNPSGNAYDPGNHSENDVTTESGIPRFIGNINDQEGSTNTIDFNNPTTTPGTEPGTGFGF